MIRDRTQRVGREAAEPIVHQRELATLRLDRRTADLGANVVGQALGLLTHSAGFRWASGVLIGSSTIMANAAGPVFSIYSLVNLVFE